MCDTNCSTEREEERLSYILANTTYLYGDISNHDLVLCDPIVVMLALPSDSASPALWMTTTPSSRHGGYISNNSSVHQKQPGVPESTASSDETSYPLTKDYMLTVAQVTGPSLLDWCSGLQVHLGAPESTLNHWRAVWEKHLLWECCWCTWKS
jgi:hypothetical protein